MDGVLTDPRLLAIEKATQGMDPQKAMDFIQGHADSGMIPGSLSYLRQLYMKAQALQKAMPQQQQQQAMQQPTIKDKLQAQVMGAQMPPQGMPPQGMMPPPQQPPAPGLAGMPTNLASPQTFSAAHGGIVAFQNRGLVEGEEGEEGDDTEAEDPLFKNTPADYLPAQEAPTADKTLSPESLRRMSPRQISALGLQSLLKPRKKPTGESNEIARQKLAKSLGIEELTKEQLKMFKDSIGQIAKQRDEAKALFAIQAGASILGQRGGNTLANIAQGFAAPVAEYAKTKKELTKEERGLQSGLITARQGVAANKLADFDRIVTQRGADAAAEAAATTATGQALMNYGQMEEQANLTLERIKAAKTGRMPGWDIWGKDLEKAASNIRAAKEKKDATALSAAQADYDNIVRNINKTTPSAITAAGNIDRTKIVAAEKAVLEQSKQGGSIFAKKQAVEKEKRKIEKKAPDANPELLKKREQELEQEIQRVRYGTLFTGAPTGGADDDYSDI